MREGTITVGPFSVPVKLGTDFKTACAKQGVKQKHVIEKSMQEFVQRYGSGSSA